MFCFQLGDPGLFGDLGDSVQIISTNTYRNDLALNSHA